MPAVGTDAIVRNTTNKLDIAAVRDLWLGDLQTTDIAEQLKITVAALQSFATKNRFPKRPPKTHRSNASVVDPTPEEIAQRAAEVRAKRTEQENERLYRYRRVEVRQYSYSSRTGIFSEM